MRKFDPEYIELVRQGRMIEAGWVRAFKNDMPEEMPEGQALAMKAVYYIACGWAAHVIGKSAEADPLHKVRAMQIIIDQMGREADFGLKGLKADAGALIEAAIGKLH